MCRKKLNNEQLWKKAVLYHGHICAGLAIGFKTALYAAELLNIDFSADEEIVCVSENDACGVDAIQAILGCSIGKGNLLFHMRGKQAFSFYNRKTNKSVRMVLRHMDQENGTMEERIEYILKNDPESLFDVMPVKIRLPENARLFESYDCDCCGERTGANWIRVLNGKKLCIDCYPQYDRFDV